MSGRRATTQLLRLGAPSLRPTPAPLLPGGRAPFNSSAPMVEPAAPVHANNARNPTRGLVRPLALKKSHPAPPPAASGPDSVRRLLPVLAAQPGHYITVHIHGFPYLVREGDQVRLPFRMPGVLPGDVLRLTRASVVGSRDYTLKGAPHVDERVFQCRATVLGTESEPLRVKIKTKRRQRRKKQAKSKHRYTILRISELNINGPESLDDPPAG
ncbi:hypothetical protein CDD83_8144 [Cordyceps sp. RAO-2017]|nr:hypothetical protein CDD83_8144 [Cordyceps sp. RAO-2017]